MKSFVIDSKNREIQVYIYGAENKDAIVICHGAGEGAGRYVELASKLSDEFAIITYTHLGHETKKAVELETIEDLTEDAINVIKYAKGAFPSVTVFAHSMGSLIIRNKLNKISKNTKLILSGAPIVSPMEKGMLYASLPVLNVLSAKGVNPMLNDMFFENKNKKIGLGDNSWISSDQSVVDEFNKNALYGQDFTNNSLKILANLTLKANSKEVYQTLNDFKDVLLISGATDVFTGNGEKHAQIIKHAPSIKSIIYPNSYHEVHNDIDSNQLIVDIKQFIKED